MRQWFTHRTIWNHEGVGIDEARAFIDTLKEGAGIATVRFEMIAIAADGNRVLTERLIGLSELRQ